jgi:hypothetical protein
VVIEGPAGLVDTGCRVTAASLVCVRERPRRGPPALLAVTALPA